MRFSNSNAEAFDELAIQNNPTATKAVNNERLFMGRAP
jgi:hypothetical protein